MQPHQTYPSRRSRGFRRAAALVERRIATVGESRGFAVAAVLTHWAEIVGADLAKSVRPVDVKYGREGLGATLTLLVRGAEAPMIEMRKEQIRERVNACYGYNAVQKIRLTQTSAEGFAEPEAAFEPAPAKTEDAGLRARARAETEEIRDPGLKAQLEALGTRVLDSNERKKRSD